MKKFLLSTLILFSILLGACAQTQKNNYTPEERAQIQTEWMKKTLQLNADQMKLIDGLNLEYAKKMEKVKSIDGRFSQLKEAKRISEEKDEKLEKIFSQDQFKTYLDKRKELREKIKEMRKEQEK